MNSRDIYIRVGQKMLKDGHTNSSLILLTTVEEKKEVIDSMNRSLIEYSYEKLCELTKPSETVMDLGVILDKIDLKLPQQERENFFEHYVHCMLNIYNTLENKGILWSPEETTRKEEYPKIEKEGNYLEFFKTAMNSSNKESALWLNQHLSKEYSNKSVKKYTK